MTTRTDLVAALAFVGAVALLSWTLAPDAIEHRQEPTAAVVSLPSYSGEPAITWQRKKSPGDTVTLDFGKIPANAELCFQMPGLPPKCDSIRAFYYAHQESK